MARPELEVEDLEEKIPLINESNRLYSIGDHWQAGAGYTGPRLPSDHPQYSQWIAEMERIFVSEDVLNEIRKRERWALTGKAWTWELHDAENKPLPETEALELKQIVEHWMEEKQVVSTVADAIEASGWAGDEGQDGRGVLRFYIPEQRLETGGTIEAEDLGAAMSLIELESPDSGTAVVFEDADSAYEKTGFISWTEELAGDEFDRAELVYIDEQGNTVLESLIDSENVSKGVVEIPLLGRLTMYQLERPLLMTNSQRSQQRFLNHVYTAFQAAIMGAAWPEDFFFGLLPPGHWEEAENGKETFVPDPMIRGAGRSHFLQPSMVIDDNDVEKAAMSGGFTRTQPVSPNLFTEARKELRNSMIASAFQEYTLLTGLAQASGEKLQLAKGDFEASATDMANETRLMVRWVIETVLLMGQFILSNSAEPTPYRALVEVRIDTGVVTTEQKLLLSQLRTDRFISHETALAEAGYSQPTAEILKIIQAMENAELNVDGATSQGMVDATGGEEGTQLRTEKNKVETPTAKNTTT